MRLLSRSKKLELQAHKLLAEAKRAAQQYEQMTRAKEVCLAMVVLLRILLLISLDTKEAGSNGTGPKER
jgi:hypothetical protein